MKASLPASLDITCWRASIFGELMYISLTSISLESLNLNLRFCSSRAAASSSSLLVHLRNDAVAPMAWELRWLRIPMQLMQHKTLIESNPLRFEFEFEGCEGYQIERWVGRCRKLSGFFNIMLNFAASESIRAVRYMIHANRFCRLY